MPRDFNIMSSVECLFVIIEKKTTITTQSTSDHLVETVVSLT